MKFQTIYQRHPAVGEKNTKPSQTLPDQSLSISEILRRYASGLPVTGNVKVPMYSEDENDFTDFNKLDLSEKMALAKDASQTINRHKQFLNEEEDKRKKRKIIEEHEKEQAAKQQPPKADDNAATTA